MQRTSKQLNETLFNLRTVQASTSNSYIAGFFNSADLNKDSKLSHDEYITFFNAIGTSFGLNIPSAYIEQTFSENDQNQDSFLDSNEVLSFAGYFLPAVTQVLEDFL